MREKERTNLKDLQWNVFKKSELCFVQTSENKRTIKNSATMHLILSNKLYFTRYIYIAFSRLSYFSAEKSVLLYQNEKFS